MVSYYIEFSSQSKNPLNAILNSIYGEENDYSDFNFNLNFNLNLENSNDDYQDPFLNEIGKTFETITYYVEKWLRLSEQIYPKR